MKAHFCFSEKKLVLLLTAGGLFSQMGATAATLSVTPSAVSNTYSGVITLNITGLTNGEQVQLHKCLDVNGNGTIDHGEPVFEAFKITDGKGFVVSGVTNINVPFDSNSATGAITATLDFAPPRPLENVVGQFIFRLSSPVGNFAPTNATFTVTNAALSQSVSGIVYSNGLSPLPGAMVVAMNWPSTRYAGAAEADGSGHYQLSLNPGDYVILPFYPGYFADFLLAPKVTLTNGMSATNNLFLTNGTVTVSGNIYDATSFTGMSGIMVQLESGSLMTIVFTDTNGNYTAGVSPASWKIKLESDHVAQRAYLVPQNHPQIDTTTGSVANVNFALPKANALFYGRITDTNGVPFANISFNAQDDQGQFEAGGFSDTNGNYCVAVLGGTNWWHCNPDNAAPPLSSCLISSSSGTNLSSGQAVLLNFTVIPATAQISGHLQDNSGNAVAGVGISASATIGGTPYNTYVLTDTNGNYSLAAASGVWNVNVSCCGDDGLESHGLTDLFPHNVTIPPTNAVLNITVYPIGTVFLNSPAHNPDGSFQFGFMSSPGVNYTIQYSATLTNWFSVLTFGSDGGPVTIVDPNAAGSSQRFYRILIGQ